MARPPAKAQATSRKRPRSPESEVSTRRSSRRTRTTSPVAPGSLRRRLFPSPAAVRGTSSSESPLLQRARSKSKPQYSKGTRRPPATVLSDDDDDENGRLVRDSDDDEDDGQEKRSENENEGDDNDLTGLDNAQLKEVLGREMVALGTSSSSNTRARTEQLLNRRGQENTGSGAELAKENEASQPKGGKRASERRAEIPQLSTPKRRKAVEVPRTPVFLEDDDEEAPEDDIGTDNSAHANISAANVHWDSETHMMHPPSGVRNLRIREQPPPVRMVLGEAISMGVSDAIFKDPFPSIEDDHKAQSKIVRRAAKKLGYQHIVERISEDPHYRIVMARVVSQRISNLRGNFKQQATRMVPLHYGLIGTTAEIKDKVGELLHDLKFAYAVGSQGKPVLTQPFKHSCIIAVLRHLVFVEKGRGGTIAQRYESTFDDVAVGKAKKRAMPDAVVCLAATAVHAALDDWKNGYHQPSPFEADTYQDVYEVMTEVLDTIRDRREGAAYKFLMAKIYEECGKGAASGAIVTSEDAIKLLDIDNMPVGDDDDDSGEM